MEAEKEKSNESQVDEKKSPNRNNETSKEEEEEEEERNGGWIRVSCNRQSQEIFLSVDLTAYSCRYTRF